MFLKKSLSNTTIKNIITLNIFSEKSYIFKNDKFSPLRKLTYNTGNFITSYIGNKDLIITSVKISRNIPEEDIEDILNIKAYEELGLDQASSYIISFYEVENAGEERQYNIFVSESEKLDNLYLPIKQQTKYIDLILPSPLLYKVLYSKEILEDNNTHCFVYFTQYDASVVLYKDGEYLYSKSIDFSLEQIYDKYCEYIGEKVDENEFYSILESEGLKTIQSDYQENFIKIFGEVFSVINDIIIYAKRAFGLDEVDQMFIGSERGPIVGLSDYCEKYLGLKAADFNFNFNVNNDKYCNDQLQYLVLLSAFEYMDNESSFVNLTMYPRAPSFTKRASGQFIISVFAAIALSLAYPLMYLVGSYTNDAKIYTLNIEDKKLTAESIKYKKILGKKKKEIQVLDNNLKTKNTIYNNKSKTLIAIYDKKINYKLKSDIFHTIAEELMQFDVYVDIISTENDTLYVSLVSTDDRKFTELIKHISETHFDEIKNIDIERINKDPENGYYEGLLKVAR